MLKLHFIFLKKDPDYLDLFQINTTHSASAKFLHCKCHLGFFCIEIHFCVNRGVSYCPQESGWGLRCAGAAAGMGCAVHEPLPPCSCAPCDKQLSPAAETGAVRELQTFLKPTGTCLSQRSLLPSPIKPAQYSNCEVQSL